jgi:hypothetical protein
VFQVVGPHTVTVAVLDRFGRSGERTFAVDVQSTGPGPVVLGSQVNGGLLQRSNLAGVAVQFSANVGASLGAADVTLRNLTTATNVPSASLVFSFNPVTNTWTISLAAGVLLPAGNYRLTVLAAGILDNGGRALAANTGVDFHLLPGDANGDRAVNDQDLFLVWQNSFQSPAAQNPNADLTGDGLVDAADLLVVRNNYRATLAAASLQELDLPGDGGGWQALSLIEEGAAAEGGDSPTPDGLAPKTEMPSPLPAVDPSGPAIPRAAGIRIASHFRLPRPWDMIPRWFQKPRVGLESLWRQDAVE